MQIKDRVSVKKELDAIAACILPSEHAVLLRWTGESKDYESIKELVVKVAQDERAVARQSAPLNAADVLAPIGQNWDQNQNGGNPDNGEGNGWVNRVFDRNKGWKPKGQGKNPWNSWNQIPAAGYQWNGKGLWNGNYNGKGAGKGGEVWQNPKGNVKGGGEVWQNPKGNVKGGKYGKGGKAGKPKNYACNACGVWGHNWGNCPNDTAYQTYLNWWLEKNKKPQAKMAEEQEEEQQGTPEPEVRTASLRTLDGKGQGTPPGGQESGCYGFPDPWNQWYGPGWAGTIREDLEYREERQGNENRDGTVANVEEVEEGTPNRDPNTPVEILVDTGASDHLLPAPYFYGNWEPCPERKFFTANGGEMRTRHKQQVSMFAQADNNRMTKMSVTGLRLPGLEGPILSAGVLTDDNIDVHLSNKGSWLQLPGSNKRLPLVKRKGTYYLRVVPDEPDIEQGRNKEK